MPPLFSCKTTSPELYAEEMKKLARAEQSRVNGAKSRGPTTERGKLKCSRGALKHGLTAKKHAILDIEDSAEYEHVYNAALEEFRPATVYAVRQVEKLAHLDWRIERVAMLETAYLNYKVNENAGIKTPKEDPIPRAASGKDELAALLQGWMDTANDPNHAFHLLRRYAGTLESQYNRTLKNVLDLEKRAHTRSLDRNLHPDVLGPYCKPELPPKEEPEPQEPQAEEEPKRKTAQPQPTPLTKHSQLPSSPASEKLPLPSENAT